MTPVDPAVSANLERVQEVELWDEGNGSETGLQRTTDHRHQTPDTTPDTTPGNQNNKSSRDKIRFVLHNMAGYPGSLVLNCSIPASSCPGGLIFFSSPSLPPRCLFALRCLAINKTIGQLIHFPPPPCSNPRGSPLQRQR